MFEDRADYLYAAVTGPRDSQEISMAYWRQIAAECERRKTRKLMVVENLGDFDGERNLARTVDYLFELSPSWWAASSWWRTWNTARSSPLNAAPMAGSSVRPRWPNAGSGTAPPEPTRRPPPR